MRYPFTPSDAVDAPGPLACDSAASTWVGTWTTPASEDCGIIPVRQVQDPTALTLVEKSSESTLESSGIDTKDSATQENWPAVAPSPSEENLPSNNLAVERPIFNCLVDFESTNGCFPSNIFTASDARRVFLFNLPPGVTYEELRDLVEIIVPIEFMDVEYYSKTAKAIIEFGNPIQACLVATQLNGQTYGGRILLVRMDTVAQESVFDPLEANSIKITWLTPTRFAWVYYPTITAAKEAAARLEGQIFCGRQVTAAFVRPRARQTESFTVKITNLPRDTSFDSLRTFCNGCSLLTLGEPTYNDDPVDKIRDLVANLGCLDSFLSLPLDYTKKKQTAFARISNNLYKVRQLDNVSQPFLGERPLAFQSVYHVSFKLSDRRFQTIRSDFERLREEQRNHCSFHLYDTGNPIVIHMFSDEPEPRFFGIANKELQSILHGEILQMEGKVIWDEYFDLTSSTKVIDKINADKAFFIKVDNRSKILRVVGNTTGQCRARTAISRLLKVVSEQRYVLPLHSIHSVRRLLDGGFKDLHDQLGGHKVTLDLTVPQIVARGDAEVLRAVQSVLETGQSLTEDEPDIVALAGLCSLCHRTPSTSRSLPCHHTYCSTCLRQLLMASLGPRFIPPQCIATISESKNDSEAHIQCTGYIPYSMIRELLSTAEETSFLRSSFLTYVYNHLDEYFFCPSPNCETVYRRGRRGALYRCPSCSMEVCSSCGVECHLGLPCLPEMAAHENG